MTHFKCVAKIWRNLTVCVKLLNVFWKVIRILNPRAITDEKSLKCYFFFIIYIYIYYLLASILYGYAQSII
jgi:hypothetical protein